MIEPSLKTKTAGAVIWNLLDRIGQQVLLFIAGIIVANILAVEDYSLIGMLAIFTAISTILLDSGFSAALIQKKDATNEDYNSVFWFNIGTGFFLYFLLLGCSPLIADFFSQPKLVGISAVIFLTLPANSFASIQATILNKEVRFQVLTKINVVAMFISAITSLTMAFTGCGVWTLAVQPVSFAVVRACLLWVQSSWRPRLAFSIAAIKGLFRFASRLLAASLINAGFMNIYSVIIGKIYPLKELGYYTQGNKMCDMGVSMLYSSIQNATFPIFSSIQNEQERLIRAYRKTMRFTAFIAFPAMVGLIIVARPLIELFLKEDWWPAIPFFQLLCIGGCFTVFTAINNNFIKAKGHSNIILRIEYFRIAITVICLLFTWNKPVLIMVGGLILTRFLLYIIHMLYTAHYTGYKVQMQLWDVTPYLLLALVMAGAAVPISMVVNNNLLLLIAQIIAGATVYLAGSYFIGSKILKESIDLIKKRRG